MSHFVEHLKALAMTLGTLGGPGLALLAFIDSSFLPLPEIPDLLLVGLVIQHPDRWPYYAAMAAVGSLGGCYVLYAIARAGGHAVLSRYLHDRHIERGLAAFRRYGLLTVVVPSILPPPMPFKPFVLVAGVSDVSPATFALAVIVGRGFRYGGEAILAYWYGPQAMDLVLHNIAQASVWFAVALAVLGAAVVLWRQRRPS